MYRIDHLLSKHGHDFDIDARFPIDPAQKDTKYKSSKIRTRLSPKNRNQFRKNLEQFGQNQNLVTFYDANIRGEIGDLYYCPITQRCIATKNDPDTGKQMFIRAQPFDQIQVERFQTQNKLE